MILEGGWIDRTITILSTIDFIIFGNGTIDIRGGNSGNGPAARTNGRSRGVWGAWWDKWKWWYR